METVKQIFKNKKKYILIVVLVLVVIVTVWYCQKKTNEWKVGIDFSCVTIEEHNISGDSMDPLFVDGEIVKGLVGYYGCNKIERNDIAVLEFTSREEKFVKRIVGLPGDSVEFTKYGEIKINEEILKNSNEKAYNFSLTSQKLITIPLKVGKVPEGRYMVLGEDTGVSSFDSRKFAFLQKDHLIGKVIKNK